MAGSTNHQAAPSVSNDAADVLSRATRLAFPTDADDDSLRELREAVLELAAAHGLSVVLYDRSEETWMDHPHPSGPCDRDAIDDEKRPHLAEQVDRFASRGVHASAWVATVPSLTEIVDVVRDLDVDVVLVPEDANGSKLIDRLKPGGPAEIVERVAALNLDRPIEVLVRHDDGSITVADPAPR